MEKIYLDFLSLLLLKGLLLFVWVNHGMKQSMLDEIKNIRVSIGSSLTVGLAEPMRSMDFLRIKALLDESVKLNQDPY